MLGYSETELAVDFMSFLTYIPIMIETDKPLVWLRSEIKTPPLSKEARLEAGFLLRRLQLGEILSMPHSRPLPGVGANCHELRINDRNLTWRIVYRIDADAILILHVFEKKTSRTPKKIIDLCIRRQKEYNSINS